MDRFQKEWSDILGKMVWFKNDAAGFRGSADDSQLKSARRNFSGPALVNRSGPARRNLSEPALVNRLEPQSSKGGIPEGQANIRKILRLKGTKRNNYYVQLTYIIKNIAYKSGFDPNPFIKYLDSVEWNADVSDAQIYAKLRDIHQEIQSKVAAEPSHTKGIGSRKMVKFLSEAGVESIERYLDYGCGARGLVKTFATELGATEENSYGVDIVQYNHPESSNFKIIENNKIPHPDNFFDLITVSWVLHHIPDKNITECIQEMYRVLSPRGTLVIREHAVLPNEINEMTINLDFMHDIYSEVLTTYQSAPWKPTDLYYAKYRSSDEWDELMKVPGFILNAFQPPFNTSIKSNPLRATVRIYNK
jgi:ubiquinone/menaquinone biosynthesis C-methylase UbiE